MLLKTNLENHLTCELICEINTLSLNKAQNESFWISWMKSAIRIANL
jgi:hypothetical protein